MSYAIYVEDIANKFWGDEGNWKSLTWNLIVENDELLRTLYESASYNDAYYNELDNEEKLEYIENSDMFYELAENYYPMMNYIHVLQSKPAQEDILKVYKNAPNIVLLEDDMSNYYIGLSGAGMDFSEEIAYAYMVVDRCVPPGFRVHENNNYSLKKEAHKELVEFLNSSGD